MRRAANLYILDTKVLAGVTTFVACCSKPTKDKIYHFVAFLRDSRAATWLLIRESLSSGRQASISLVSKVIPRKVRHWEGPSTFSKARDIPNIEQVSLIV